MTPKSPDSKLLLTELEAARLLGVSQRTVWALGARGEFPVIRIGRAKRFDRRDILHWIEQQKRDDTDAAPHPG